MAEIEYRLAPPLADEALNRLYASAWPRHRDQTFADVLGRSLTYVCAFDGERLVGFVYVAWDGRQHGFILDTTVDPEYQRRGIGTEVVRRAAEAATEAGLEWLHVDYDPHLDGFYRGCGFRPTPAGLMRLAPPSA